MLLELLVRFCVHGLSLLEGVLDLVFFFCVCMCVCVCVRVSLCVCVLACLSRVD